MGNSFRILTGRPNEKRPLARSRRHWEDKVKFNLVELRRPKNDWIRTA